MPVNRYGILLLLLLSGFAYSQPRTTLKVYLERLEAEYKISFNYLEEDVAGIEISPAKPGKTLAQILADTEQQSGLTFLNKGRFYNLIADGPRPFCGYLIDTESGAPVENAGITSGNFSTSTDADGFFRLEGGTTAEVQHPTYQGIILRRDPTIQFCQNFNVTARSQQLDEVITQRIIATGISKSKSGSFKIRPAGFGILPGLTEPDVLQTMQQIPGIYSVDELVSNLNIRSGTHDQNLFLWNGIRMFQTGHFFGLISGFNPHLAQSVTISKNGTSAFFGESVAGLVDISTDPNAATPTQNQISFNTLNGEAHTLQKLGDKSVLSVSGRRSFTDFYSSPAYQNYRDRIFQNTVVDGQGNEIATDTAEDFYFFDFTAGFRSQIGKHRIGADVIAMQNELEVLQTATTTSQKNTLRQQNLGASVNAVSQWTPQLRTTVHTTYSDYRLRGESGFLTSGVQLNQRNEVRDFSLLLRADFTKSEWLSLSGGYQFRTTGVTSFDQITSPAFRRTVTEMLQSHSLIGEVTYHSPLRQLFVRGGVRINYFDKLSTILAEPRVQLNYRLSESWQLEILGEMKSQTLAQVIDRQQDFLGIEKRRWIIANNDNVPLQQSAQFSAGVTYRKNGWLLSGESFVRRIDGITTRAQGFQDDLIDGNASGISTVTGVELFAQKQINRVYAWVSYTFNNSDYEFDDLVPGNFTNNFELRHTLNSALIYEWRGVKLALGNRFHSGRPYSPIFFGTDATPFFGGPNTSRLPVYWQTNLSAAKMWAMRDFRLEIGLSVLNIFNTRNIIDRAYLLNQASALQLDTYSLKRTPNVNVRILF